MRGICIDRGREEKIDDDHAFTTSHARGSRDSGDRPAICPNPAVHIPGWHRHGGGRHDRRDQVPHGSSVERVSPLCQHRLRSTHHDRMLQAKVQEALLYGCSTWPLLSREYSLLPSQHHRLLLRYKLPEELTLLPPVIVRGDSGDDRM